MKFLKAILKAILFIVMICFVCILSIDLIVYNTRDITKQFMSEEAIKKSIQNINILDLLKDQDGNELEAVTEVKQQLVDAGIPAETVESFIDSEPVKELTSNATKQIIDYVFYDKEIETPQVSQAEIMSFIRTNMQTVVAELQENNVPHSELLTEEKQEEILRELEEQAPILEAEFNKVTTMLEETIKGTDEYEQIEEYQKKVDEVLSVIRYIYGKEVDTILLVVAIASIIAIILCSVSFYKYLKWIGYAFLICGSALYTVSMFIPKLYQYIHEVPFMFQNLFTMILDDSTAIFVSKSIPCFIIGGLLIVSNIVIHFIVEKRQENKLTSNM